MISHVVDFYTHVYKHVIRRKAGHLVRIFFKYNNLWLGQCSSGALRTFVGHRQVIFSRRLDKCPITPQGISKNQTNLSCVHTFSVISNETFLSLKHVHTRYYIVRNCLGRLERTEAETTFKLLPHSINN